MSGRERESAEQWMRKAGNDLFTARHVLAAPNGPTDTPCFHAQQAAEKALKALLTVAGQHAERTHDLPVLLEQAVPLLPELKAHRIWCVQLAEYAVGVRYPAGMQEPSRQEAEEALTAATALFAACRKHLDSTSADAETAEGASDQTDAREDG